MAYSNGLNNLQHFISTVATPAVTEVKRNEPSLADSTVASTKGNSHSAADHTKLSTTSTLVNHALSGSDVRTDKVSALQQAIAAGTYQVSSSDVAGSVINALLN